MILLTFSNNETYEFQKSFDARAYMESLTSKGISVSKVRCNTSDYTAIMDYARLLNSKIQ